MPIHNSYENNRIYTKNHKNFNNLNKRAKRDIITCRKRNKPIKYNKYARWYSKYKYDILAQRPSGKLTSLEKLKVTSSRFTYTLKESIKGDLTIKGIISDWKAASKIGKAGKALGVIGTGLTIFSDFDENILSKLNNGVGVTWRDGREFVTDTAVDLGAGYISMALGTAIIGGPVGLVAGIAIGSALQAKWPSGKSSVDYIKDGISGVCDWVGSWF